MINKFAELIRKHSRAISATGGSRSHNCLQGNGDLRKFAQDLAIQSNKRNLLLFCQSHKFTVVSGTRRICDQIQNGVGGNSELSGDKVRFGRVDYVTRHAERNQVLANRTGECVSKF